VLAPLSGWIHHAALDGFAPIWWPFGQNLPLVPKDEGLAHLFGNIHWIFTKVMAVSLLLHIAGALKHHIIDKDVTLRRMWFGQTDVPHLTKHRSPAAAPILAVAVFAATGWLASTWHADAAAPLAAVSSEWEVQDGTLSIGVTQSGSDISGEFSEWTAQIAFNPEATPNYGDVTATIAHRRRNTCTTGPHPDRADCNSTIRKGRAIFSRGPCRICLKWLTQRPLLQSKFGSQLRR